MRPIVRATVGKSLDAKQDRAATARRTAELISLRARNPARLERVDFMRVGEDRGVEPWKLHGLVDIESSRGGFDSEGRAVVVPELHKFSKFTGHFYDKTHPDLSIKDWVHPKRAPAGHPYRLGNRDRWDILARQAALNFDAAIKASSWFAFQTMGFNWQMLGFDSPMDMVVFGYESERNQLDLAVRYLIATDGLDALIADDYYRASIAQNGTGKPREFATDWEEASLRRRSLYA